MGRTREDGFVTGGAVFIGLGFSGEGGRAKASSARAFTTRCERSDFGTSCLPATDVSKSNVFLFLSKERIDLESEIVPRVHRLHSAYPHQVRQMDLADRSFVVVTDLVVPIHDATLVLLASSSHGSNIR